MKKKKHKGKKIRTKHMTSAEILGILHEQERMQAEQQRQELVKAKQKAICKQKKADYKTQLAILHWLYSKPKYSNHEKEVKEEA